MRKGCGAFDPLRRMQRKHQARLRELGPDQIIHHNPRGNGGVQ